MDRFTSYDAFKILGENRLRQARAPLRGRPKGLHLRRRRDSKDGEHNEQRVLRRFH